MKYILPLVTLPLMGCAQLGLPMQNEPVATAPAPAATDSTAAPPPPQAARTVEQFDTTTAEQRAAAAAPASGGASLGTAVASLGDPSQPGFWVETDLVSAVGSGRITLIASGQSVEVELRPIGGGSARVSLAAWRLLEVPLTDLAEIEIFLGDSA
ncbi:MAG: hypothetical protein ABJF50_08620 [Paracoccaceae bacterium]